MMFSIFELLSYQYLASGLSNLLPNLTLLSLALLLCKYKKLRTIQCSIFYHKKKTGETQSQIVQSVMYSYDAVISSYITRAIHSCFCIESAKDFDDET